MCAARIGSCWLRTDAARRGGADHGVNVVWEEMKGHQERCVYIPENAIEPSRFEVTEPPARRAAARRVRGPARPAQGGRHADDAAAR